MKKRMFPLALAAMLLAACGGAQDAPAAGEPPATSEAAETPDPAGDDPLVIVRTDSVLYLQDGSQDAVNEQISYFYEEDGRLASIEVEQDGTPVSRTEVLYDENGVKTAYRLYDGEGNETGTNTFDADGNLVALHSVAEYASGGSTEHSELDATYTYDEQGRLTEEKTVSTSMTQIVRTTYHGDGTATRETEQDGELLYADALTLDENGNVVREQRTDADGAALSTVVTTYNENGDPLTEVSTDGNGEVQLERTYTYDEDGHLLRLVWDLPQSARLQEDTHTYDEHGNRLSSQTVINGETTSVSTFTFLPLSQALAQQAA